MFRRTHDLIRLARPFPEKYVRTAPKSSDGFGGSYVSHDVYEQKLIVVLKRVPRFEVVEVIRGYVPELKPNPNGKSPRAKEGRPALENAVVGVIARMTVEIDGNETTVQVTGDCGDPFNWPHDGARLKDAESDAYKRCAMRLGVGLHLWSKNAKEFFLYDQLQSEAEAELNPAPGSPADPPGEYFRGANGEWVRVSAVVGPSADGGNT